MVCSEVLYGLSGPLLGIEAVAFERRCRLKHPFKPVYPEILSVSSFKRGAELTSRPW